MNTETSKPDRIIRGFLGLGIVNMLLIAVIAITGIFEQQSREGNQLLQMAWLIIKDWNIYGLVATGIIIICLFILYKRGFPHGHSSLILGIISIILWISPIFLTVALPYFR